MANEISNGEAHGSPAMPSAHDAIAAIGLGLFFCWMWAALQNPTSPIQEANGGHASALTGAVVALACAIVLGRAYPAFSQRPSLAVTAALLVAYIAIPLATTPSSAVSAGAAGALAAWMLSLWGVRIGEQGPRKLVSMAIFALALAFVAAVGIYSLPADAADALVSLLPFASAIALGLVSVGAFEHQAEPKEQDAAIPRPQASSFKFFATLFVQGMAYGLLHFLYGSIVLEQCDDPYCPLRHIQPLFPISVTDFYGFASVAGLILAACIMLVSIKALRLNFRKLLYVVGFPLAALGFLIIGSDDGLKAAEGISHASGLNFVYGEIVFVSGYYYIIAISWALCAHLGRIGKECRRTAFVWASLALMAGQLAGFMLSGIAMQAEMSRSNLCFLALFALMLASLLIATNDSLWAEWGAARPGDAERSGLFKTACQHLSAACSLTPREAEILALLARGRSMSFVAENLVISKDTVKTHARSIYRKLQVHSQQEIIDLVEAEIGIVRDQTR